MFHSTPWPMRAGRVLCLLALQLAAAAQPASILNPAKPVQADLKGGETRVYEISVNKGQYVQILVDQKGIDVVERVLAPSGDLIVRMDTSNGRYGPERVSWVAAESGRFGLEISSPSRSAAPGRLSIAVEHLRIPLAADRERVEAQQEYLEARALRSSDPGTASKYEEAAAIFHRVGTATSEALCQFGAATAYEAARQPEQAIAAYRRAALILRASGDAATEGTVMVRLGQLQARQILYPDAIVSQERALVLRRLSTGPDSRETAFALNDLGLTYRKSGAASKAEGLFRQAVKIAGKVLGPEDPDVATMIGNLAVDLLEQDRFEEAEPLARQSLALKEKMPSADNASTATSANNLAFILYRQGKLAEAEPIYRRALAIDQKIYGPDDPETATDLDNLGKVLLERGQYAEAGTNLRRALAIRESKLGTTHPDTSISYNNVAILLHKRGDRAGSEAMYRKALAADESRLGKDDPSIAQTLLNLSRLLNEERKRDEAEALLRRALPIQEREFGKQSSRAAAVLVQLGQVLFDAGREREAEETWRRAVRIADAASLPRTGSVSSMLDDLASALSELGDFVVAERLSRKALAITEEISGPDDPDTATSVNNLGFLLYNRGDYKAAEPLFRRAISIDERHYGPDHPSVARDLDNLAKLLDDTDRDEEAERLTRRALDIRERAFGPDDPETGTSLQNLALLVETRGQFEEAEQLYRRSLNIDLANFGPNDTDVALTSQNLAALLQTRGRFDEAGTLYHQALEIYEKRLGANSPDTASVLSSLAELELARGNPAASLPLYEHASEIEESHLAAILSGGSEREKQSYLDYLEAETDARISFHTQYAPKSVGACRLALLTVLRRKARVLDAVSLDLSRLRKRLTPQDKLLLDRLADVRARRAKSALVQAAATDLEREAEQVEAQISTRIAELRGRIQPVTIAAVEALIPSDAALVEYVSYQPFNPKNPRGKQWGARRYAAYVLLKGVDPAWVDLGPSAPIDRLAVSLRRALASRQSEDYQSLARDADQQIFEKIVPLVRGRRHLLLSPDGSLNLVPYQALLDGENKFRAEEYTFSYLSSGRDLLRLQNELSSAKPAVIVANPTFRAAESPAPQNTNLRVAELPPFEQLAPTEEEAREIRKALSGAQVLIGPAATKSAVERLSGPEILHIATHGFFLPDLPDKQKASPGSSPARAAAREASPQDALLRSGLALAGANRSRVGSTEGLLTALEASGLDLAGTEMVVLSACETGLGDTSNGAGVYGLRRAFALAGAKTQVMSLWKVNDEATEKLMVSFYETLRAGVSRSQALRSVQLDMIGKPEFRHPYYWAAFILSGDWRPIRLPPALRH